MIGFVLAGGLGTRLRPQFGDLPKPLAPIGGRPVLARQLEWLADHGVHKAVVCAGYGADQLIRELGPSSVPGIEIAYSVEDEPLGTGGALRHAARFVDGPALVVNGDTLLTCEPWELERARWEHNAIGAVALYETPSSEARGRGECDAEGRITRFVEKDSRHVGPARVNGGLYAFAPSLWRELPPGSSSLERDVLPRLAEQGVLVGHSIAGEFFDIGTPEDWERAERRFTG